MNQRTDEHAGHNEPTALLQVGEATLVDQVIDDILSRAAETETPRLRPSRSSTSARRSSPSSPAPMSSKGQARHSSPDRHQNRDARQSHREPRCDLAREFAMGAILAASPSSSERSRRDPRATSPRSRPASRWSHKGSGTSKKTTVAGAVRAVGGVLIILPLIELAAGTGEQIIRADALADSDRDRPAAPGDGGTDRRLLRTRQRRERRRRPAAVPKAKPTGTVVAPSRTRPRQTSATASRRRQEQRPRIGLSRTPAVRDDRRGHPTTNATERRMAKKQTIKLRKRERGGEAEGARRRDALNIAKKAEGSGRRRTDAGGYPLDFQ